ncbi:HNH endonuclease [Aureimonas sp. SK2]|uniref:HNH endonuclease n=1 Tax=Aureimonas sp. SK2 TaxID=3015992 RepID=UPI0024441DC4|nr:HNH endonuclease [Aureimonas sp. SK2]
MRKHRGWKEEAPETAVRAEEPCWLCSRPLGRRIEWHHPLPKSRGGRDTVPVHPICHRTIHACFSNVDLERHARDELPLASNPDLARFLKWIAGKPPDFHAPTRRVR